MVTGEAVLIDVPPASVAIRAVARIIDTVLYLVLLFSCLIVVFAQAGSASEASSATLALLCTVGWLLAVPVAIETFTRGRSLGKLICSLRVVRDDSGPIVFRHALVRGLIGVVEFFVAYGIPAVISSIASVRAKRLGDLAAGTYVVQENVRLTLTAPPQVPMRLEQWASSCDIPALPDGVALAVRQFLLRRGTLSPAARARLCADLSAVVRPVVAPPPPLGTGDEEFLAAVLAERRRRDQERLARDNRLRERVVPLDELTGRR